MTAPAYHSMLRTAARLAVCAEKSDVGAGCGEIVAPGAESLELLTRQKQDDARATGLLAMNMLRIPKTKPRSARASRKNRDTSQSARLELTLEMPSHRPPVREPEPEEVKSERGVVDVDFYI